MQKMGQNKAFLLFLGHPSAHQAKLKAGSAVAPSPDVSSRTTPAAAADVVGVQSKYLPQLSPLAVSAGPTPPPLQVNAAPADPCPPVPAVAAAVPAAKGAQGIEVNDELCPDTEYEENDGKTSFRCLQCKMFFLPMSYKYGDEIVDYRECRQHIGVIKCETEPWN